MRWVLVLFYGASMVLFALSAEVQLTQEDYPMGIIFGMLCYATGWLTYLKLNRIV